MRRSSPEAPHPAALARAGLQALFAAFAVAAAPLAAAQGSVSEEIAKYRAALQDGNPAELWEARGADLWKQRRGPSQASLERCDLGLGPGVVKGAYAQLPRYFADADRVMDLETRLVWCMVRLQGYTEAEATRNHFGNGNDRKSDLEALTAYVTSESRGITMNVSLRHPKESEAYRIGEKLFYFRGGTHDFACATCHGEEGKRIRMSELPVLYKPQYARPLLATWPAYRVSTSSFVTLQWRMNDCYRQMRMPEPAFASDSTVALIQFLTVTAQGEPYRGPAIKR